MMKGFTLIELLIALSLFMVLSTLTLISTYAIFSKNELQVIEDEIKTAVRYASTQSVVKGKTLYLSSLSESENWSSGMAVYDFKHNKKHLIYQWRWRHPQWQVYWLGFSSKQVIPFSHHPQHSASNGVFRLYNPKTKQHKNILLNRLGRIKEQDKL